MTPEIPNEGKEQRQQHHHHHHHSAFGRKVRRAIYRCAARLGFSKSNFGLAKLTGDFTSKYSADEILFPNTTRRLEAELERHKVALIPARNLEYEIAEILNARNGVTHRRRKGLLSGSIIIDFNGTKVVVKKYGDIRSSKWMFLRLWAPGSHFRFLPVIRLYHSYNAITKLNERGIPTPRVVAVSLRAHVMVREFVEGTPVSTTVKKILKGTGSQEDHRLLVKFGEHLAMIHSAGFALGDAKAENILSTAEGLVPIDFEQSMEAGNYAWDIAEFLYFSGLKCRSTKEFSIFAEEFLAGYSKYGDPKYIAEARRIKYLIPFEPILSPPIAFEARKHLKRHSEDPPGHSEPDQSEVNLSSS